MNPWQALTDPPVVVQSAQRHTSDLSERGACAVKLLRLGPLCWKEFVTITGWPAAVASRVLLELKQFGLVYRAMGEWRLV